MGLIRKKTIATVLLAVCIVTITAVVIPVWAPPPTSAPIHNMLSKYYRVNLLVPWEPEPDQDIEVPISETTYIVHGWVTGGEEGDIPDWPFWSEMTSEQKNEYLETANFELSIDGIPVELRRFQWYNHDQDGMYVLYYAVLPPNTFAEYDVITGYWSVDFEGTTYDYTATRTVILPS